MSQPAEPIAALRGVSRRFGATVALEDVDFELRPGEIHALLGENGAGKTTLMNALFGLVHPDTGEVQVGGRPLEPFGPREALARGLGLVHQHFALSERHTVLENLVLGWPDLPWFLRWGALRARARQIGARFGLEVPLDARIADLPVGVRQKVEILKALFQGARTLLLDEPTATLTDPETEALFSLLERFRAEGGSAIFTSHKLGEVIRLADRITVLRRGRVVGRFVRGQTSASELAALMVGRIAPPTGHTAEIHHGRVVLALDHVTVHRASGRPLLERVSLRVRAGEVLGIAGVAGSGQRALADLLGGLLRPDEGRLQLFGRTIHAPTPAAFARAGVAYIPEDRLGVGTAPGLSVMDNLLLRSAGREFAEMGLIRWPAARAWASERIAEYNIRCGGPDAIVSTLSGGNVQKVILARELAGAPELIVAAYPARGLDIGAAEAVRERLLTARWRGAAIVLFSEDLDEIFRMADNIGVLYEGRLVALQPRMDVTRAELGRWMGGQDLPHTRPSAPAEA